MAFLCPVRIRRNKKKYESDFAPGTMTRQYAPMGRITGSASVETLVRVGIEKENGLSADSKMLVVHDFTPCVDDELKVRRGQIVNVLYQENDWVYVISENQQHEGFIPYSYCAPLEPQITYKKKMPRSQLSSMVSSGFQEMPNDLIEDNDLIKLASQNIHSPDMLVGVTSNSANFESGYRSHYSPNSSSLRNESASQKNYNQIVEATVHSSALCGSAMATSMVSACSNGVHSNFSSNHNSHTRSRAYKSTMLPSMHESNYRSTNNQALLANRHFGWNNRNRAKSPSNSVLRNLDMYFTNAYNQVPINLKDPIPSGDVQPFFKNAIGRYIVLFSFYSRNENDVNVEKGEVVTVLNREDPNWSWIIKRDSSAGFVPSIYICPIEMLLNAHHWGMSKISNENGHIQPRSTHLANAYSKMLNSSYGTAINFNSRQSNLLNNHLKYH